MIKILIGGSPCTKWSIAQKNGRETEPSGEGWELFKNYSIAKQKFNPDFFLYENNKSAAQAIKDQISKELGVKLMHINSALVSAQHRQRFYAFNWEVEQPEDRGILLKDILESGCSTREKSLCIDANYYRGGNLSNLQKQSGQRLMVAEPVAINTTDNDDKARTLIAGYYKYGVATLLTNEGFKGGTTAVAEPCCVAQRGRNPENPKLRVAGLPTEQMYEAKTDGKTNCLTRVAKDNLIAEPLRVGALPRPNGELSTSQALRVYNSNGKSINLVANGGGLGAKTGLYAIPCATLIVREATKKGYVEVNPMECIDLTQPNSKTRRGRSMEDKSNCLTTSNAYYQYCVVLAYAVPCEWDENGTPTKAISCADGKTYTVYEVKDGQITIKGKQYPIKLIDGYYIIRKLTVKECCRLQTMPDDYFLDENGEKIISDSQAYKCLGNGWTAEVIIHILQGALKDVPKDEEIIVLSMYDGIATGRYCLDKMGFTNIKYYAYEIDEYAKKVAMANYPDIIQCGNAFDVRKEDWRLEI